MLETVKAVLVQLLGLFADTFDLCAQFSCLLVELFCVRARAANLRLRLLARLLEVVALSLAEQLQGLQALAHVCDFFFDSCFRFLSFAMFSTMKTLQFITPSLALLKLNAQRV